MTTPISIVLISDVIMVTTLLLDHLISLLVNVFVQATHLFPPGLKTELHPSAWQGDWDLSPGRLPGTDGD